MIIAIQYTGEYSDKIKQYINATDSKRRFGWVNDETSDICKISHMVINYIERSGNLFIVVKILYTPYGEIIKSMLNDSVNLNVSALLRIGYNVDVIGINITC